METKDLKDLVHFSTEGPATRELFESDRLWSEVVCLERNQQLGPIGDPESDGLFVVIAGDVVIQVGKDRKRLKQWGTALAPAGAPVTITNASMEPAVILVVAAPPPTPRAVSG